MPDGYDFDLPSAQRIARAVLKIERLGAIPPARQASDYSPIADVPLPFYCDEDVPAGGIIVDNGVDMEDGYPVLIGRSTQVLGERPIYVARSEDSPADERSWCYPPGKRAFQVAYYDTDGTPAIGESWGPVPGQYTVRKGLPGFKILLAGENGLVWAMADQGDTEFYGKLDEDLNSGSTSATCSIYYLNSTTWTDRAINEEVYAPPLLSSGKIASGKWVRLKWFAESRRLEVVGAEC